jgi:hypothetical protein
MELNPDDSEPERTIDEITGHLIDPATAAGVPQSMGILPDTPEALNRHLDQSRKEAAEHPERLVPMDQFAQQLRAELAAL